MNKREESIAKIEKVVKAIVAEKLVVSEDKITPQASFVDDLGADSLDMVELSMAFEDAFCIEIPSNDEEKLVTVQNAIDYLEVKIKEKFTQPN